MSDVPGIPKPPTLHERAGRRVTLDEIALSFADVAKAAGCTDLLVILCGQGCQHTGFERTAYMDANWQKVALVLAEMIRLNFPEDAKALLVREIYELKADPRTHKAVREPREWVH